MPPQDRYPVIHRDGTVSYWSFSRQEWVEHAIYVPAEDRADMEEYDRERVEKHLGLVGAVWG